MLISNLYGNLIYKLVYKLGILMITNDFANEVPSYYDSAPFIIYFIGRNEL